MSTGKETLTLVPDFSTSVMMGCPSETLNRGGLESLADFLAGQNYTYDHFPDRTRKLGRRQVAVYEPNDTRRIAVAGVGIFYGHEIIHITKGFLEQMAQLDQKAIAEIRQRGEIIQVGFPFEIMYLIGCEEAFHHLHPEFNSLFCRNPWDAKREAHYDAILAEYKALKFQLEAAIEHKFHPRTIRHLKHRIVQAERKGIRR